MTRHIILAYGRETEHWRATFAVLSFWAWYGGNREDVKTVIFTDKPEFFAPYLTGLPVEYSVLTTPELEKMYGPQRYIHRAKLVILEQTLQAHPEDNVLFCDSDTFFITAAEPMIQRLQAGTTIMHLCEFTVADAVGVYASFSPAQDEYPRKLIQLIESRDFWVGAKSFRFSKDQFIWNSGVLGLTKEVGGLMPDICALNDDLYAGSGWITSEQIAFSFALQETTTIIPSDQYVFHYWGKQQKVLMDSLLPELGTTPFKKLALEERLEEVRQLTDKWQRAVELDKVREGALYAFSHGELFNGLKRTAKAILVSRFDAAFTKELLVTARKSYSN